MYHARYDHFMANGFPVWKGTEYYYSRYRPGLGTVLVGVFLLGGGGFHYIALYMGWKRQRLRGKNYDAFIDKFINHCRELFVSGMTDDANMHLETESCPTPARSRST